MKMKFSQLNMLSDRCSVMPEQFVKYPDVTPKLECLTCQVIKFSCTLTSLSGPCILFH